MNSLDAVRAGYDEVTHINFIMMQAMPQDVVDKSNTAARIEGPAKYGKDVDLDVKIDPAILGGLVVKLGSRMVDSSLRTKLNAIRHAMKEAR